MGSIEETLLELQEIVRIKNHRGFLWNPSKKIWEVHNSDQVLELGLAHIGGPLTQLSIGDRRKIFSNHKNRFVDLQFEVNSNPFILPIQDGKVIDLKTLVVRDRTSQDHFTYECPVRWITWVPDIITEILTQYHPQLVDCLASLLIPGNKVYSWVGSNTGRSTVARIIQDIFPQIIQRWNDNFLDPNPISRIIEDQIPRYKGNVINMSEKIQVGEVMVFSKLENPIPDFYQILDKNRNVIFKIIVQRAFLMLQ